MKRLLIALALLTLCTTAHGATLEWINPTTFVDNTPITQEYLGDAFVRVYEGDTATGPWNRTPDSNYVIGYPGTSATVPATEGKYYTVTFVVRCDPTLPMTNENKCQSDYATPVKYTVIVTPPPPPPPVTGKKPTPPGQLKFR